MGPIALLCEEVQQVGAEINVKFKITQQDDAAINLLETPWQLVNDLVEDMAKRARMRRTGQKTKFL